MTRAAWTAMLGGKVPLPEGRKRVVQSLGVLSGEVGVEGSSREGGVPSLGVGERRSGAKPAQQQATALCGKTQEPRRETDTLEGAGNGLNGSDFREKTPAIKRARAPLDRNLLKRAGLLVLPFPPSVNHYWRSTAQSGRSRVYLSDAGRQYRKQAFLEARLQYAPRLGEAAVAVHVDAYPPDRRRRDLDNLLKGLLDSLCYAGCFADDSQVADLRIRRMPVQHQGAVVVKVVAL